MYIYLTVSVRLYKSEKHSAEMRKLAEQPEEPKEQKEKSKSEQCTVLENALEAEKKRSEEYLTQLKYARADIENLEKRFDRQLEDAKKHANERIMIELLDIVDELELAVKSAKSCGSSGTLTQGVEMILKKFTKILENEGVTPIRSVGEPFDPEKHNAVARTEENGIEGVTIKEEIRKGYTMRGKVIRPSTVKVAVPSSQSQKVTEGEEPK
jgi:molecular chaperone GrpE